MGTGKQHVIGPDIEFGMYGSALTADGTTVLGTFGQAEEIPNVVTIPWTGRRPHVIARNASDPSWSRP